jgi:hypothetical protein
MLQENGGLSYRMIGPKALLHEMTVVYDASMAMNVTS